MTITIPLWAFILLCIAALPVALILAFFLLVGIFFIVSIIIVVIIDLFKLDDYYEEEPLNINKAKFLEDSDDPDYNPEYIPPEERK